MQVNENELVELYSPLLARMVDAHCHVQQVEESDQIAVKHLLVMGTKEQDWETVQKLSDNPKFLPCFGLHPWYVHEASDRAIQDLQARLITASTALVGEIGIDTLAKNRSTGEKLNLTLQSDFFHRQLILAAEFARHVSIHSVKALGHISPILSSLSKENKKRIGNIMMHSFSGSPQAVDELIRIPIIGDKVYFSLSYFVNSRTSPKKFKSLVLAIPDNRLLIESDLEIVSDIPAALLKICWMISQAKQWTMEDTVDILFHNSRRFLGFSN